MVQRPKLQTPAVRRSAKTSIASAEAGIAKLEATLIQLKTGYDQHTHSYDKPYLGGVWPMKTLKANLDSPGYLVHVITADNIPLIDSNGLDG